MLTRVAKEAQKRGQKEFTLRGIEAGDQFRAHANRLAPSSVAGSGKVVQGSAAAQPYQATLDAARVLSSGAQQDRRHGGRRRRLQERRRAATRAFSSSAPTLVRTQGGRPVGRISPEQMETYLLDVLAKRQDLRPSHGGEAAHRRAAQQEVTCTSGSSPRTGRSSMSRKAWRQRRRAGPAIRCG